MATDHEFSEKLDQLLIRWSPGLSRRDFLRRSGLSLGALATSSSILAIIQACGGSASPASSQSGSTSSSLKGTGQVVYAGYGGIYQQGMQSAVFNHFTSDTGITVQVTADGGNIPKIAAAVKAGAPQWDVVENPVVTRGVNLAQGILQKYNKNIVDISGIVDKRFIDDYGASFYSYAATLFWNTKALTTPLNSWADVWNTTKFPGKRGFQNSSVRTLVEAVLADGVAVDNVFPIDMTRAYAALNRIKSNAVFQALNTITNLAAQQDIVAGDLNLARTKTLLQSKVPVAYTWNQAIVDSDALGVVAGAQNVDNANKLLAYSLLPQTQLRVLDVLAYTPTVKTALDILTVDQLKDLAGTTYTLPTSVVLDGAYFTNHYTANEQMFQRWLLTL